MRDAHLGAGRRHAEDHARAAPVERVDGTTNDGRMTDAFERPVHRRNVSVGGGDEVGRAELAGQRLLLGQKIDGDDAPGAGDAGALDHVQADAADAEHGDRLARLDVGPVERGADAGQHAAADEAGRAERDVVAGS